MIDAVKAEMKGVASLVKQMEKLKQGVRNRILRKAMRNGAKPVVKAARQLVPVKSKQMRKSLGFTFRAYRNGVVVAVIGVRKNFRTVIDGKPVNPANYLHLVILGTKHQKADNFLLKAYKATGKEAEKIIADVIEVELQRLGL